MQLRVRHTSAAALPKWVGYFNFGARIDHCSRFPAIGKRILREPVVSCQFFILVWEIFLSSTMVKNW